MKSFIELKNVKKTYIIGEQKFNALDGIDLSINQGAKLEVNLKDETIWLTQKHNLDMIKRIGENNGF